MIKEAPYFPWLKIQRGIKRTGKKKLWNMLLLKIQHNPHTWAALLPRAILAPHYRNGH